MDIFLHLSFFRRAVLAKPMLLTSPFTVIEAFLASYQWPAAPFANYNACSS